MRKRYGVPYQGSKNQIAKDIVSVLPVGRRFVDLFAGGCAITHAAMESGKYETFLANDLHGMGVRLFVDGMSGKCEGAWKKWVSREEFYAKRDTDPLIALCWSFGNNQSQYVYGEHKEKLKKLLHEALVRGNYDEVAEKSDGDVQMQAIAALRQVEALSRVDALRHVECSYISYDEVPYEDGDVVYCDIPYRTASEEGGGYRFLKRSGIRFDFDRFYAWCESRPYPVFVSEYEMPGDRFVSIWHKEKVGLFKKTKDGQYHNHIEHVFVQRKFADRFADMCEEVERKAPMGQMEFQFDA